MNNNILIITEKNFKEEIRSIFDKLTKNYYLKYVDEQSSISNLFENGHNAIITYCLSKEQDLFDILNYYNEKRITCPIIVISQNENIYDKIENKEYFISGFILKDNISDKCIRNIVNLTISAHKNILNKSKALKEQNNTKYEHTVGESCVKHVGILYTRYDNLERELNNLIKLVRDGNSHPSLVDKVNSLEKKTSEIEINLHNNMETFGNKVDDLKKEIHNLNDTMKDDQKHDQKMRDAKQISTWNFKNKLVISGIGIAAAIAGFFLGEIYLLVQQIIEFITNQ